MKHLKDNILEKLKVDNITADKFIGSNFPFNKSIEDIKNFLDENGFCGLTGKIHLKIKQAIKYFNNYAYDFYYDYISIGIDECLLFANMNRGKISNDNPLFYIYNTGGTRTYYICYNADSNDPSYSLVDRKEWIRELDRIFN